MKIFKALTILVMLLTVALPLNLNAESAVNEKFKRDLVFYVNEPGDTGVLNSLMNKKHESYLFAQSGVKKGSVNVNVLPKSSFKIRDQSSVALPFNFVSNNKEVANKLNDALSNGIKVYLYSEKEFTTTDYTNVLGLDGLTTTQLVNGKKLKMNINGHISSEKKVNNNKDLTEYNVIGYSKKSDGLPITLNSFAGNKNAVNSVILLSTVINNELKTYNANQNKELRPSVEDLKKDSKFLSFSFNKVSATKVDFDSTQQCQGFIKPNSIAINGEVCTSYELHRDTDETDPDTDDFAVKEFTDVDTYNDTATVVEYKSEHNLEYSDDTVYDYTPETTLNSTDFTIGLPWSISYTFTIGDEPADVNVTNTADYAKYQFTDFNRAHLHFEPITSWHADASTAKITGVDIINQAKYQYYDSGTVQDWASSQTLNIEYYYGG